MTDKELLPEISTIMDKKLKPVNDRLQKIKQIQENDVLPLLQNMKLCYTSTYKCYSSGIEQLAAMQADIDIMRKVILEHSERA